MLGHSFVEHEAVQHLPVHLDTVSLSDMPTEKIMHVCVFGSNCLAEAQLVLLCSSDQRFCVVPGKNATGANFTLSKCCLCAGGEAGSI